MENEFFFFKKKKKKKKKEAKQSIVSRTIPGDGMQWMTWCEHDHDIYENK